MRRRSASQLLRRMRLMSRPSNRIWPAVGRSSRRMQRPVVVLPQPLSPTRPSVSPRLIVKSTPSTAFTSPILRLQHDALGDREVHGEAAHLEQRCRSARAVHAATSCAGARARRCGSRRRDGPPSPAGSSGGRAWAQALDGEAAARAEGAAAVEPRQIGRLALDRIEPRLARPVEPRHRAQQRHRVGMARIVIDRSAAGPLSTMRPAYITLTRLA